MFFALAACDLASHRRETDNVFPGTLRPFFNDESQLCALHYDASARQREESVQSTSQSKAAESRSSERNTSLTRPDRTGQ